MMRRSPGFTGVALLTMALGVGANTAIFSIVNGVILKPLPYPEADRIVQLEESNLSRGWSTFSVAPLNYWDWKERNRSLELIAAFQEGPPTTRAATSRQSSRSIGSRRTSSRSSGRSITVDGVAHTVVGILPRGWWFVSQEPTDLILPLRPRPFWYKARGSHFIRGLGGLRTGVSLEQARSDFSSVAASLENEYPETDAGWGAVVSPLENVIVGSTRAQLLIFTGVGARDPLVFAAVPLVLLATAVPAILVPAYRATRVDPIRILGEG